ncbi:hypothetical protein ES708_08669 [subsurface metagenome]
MSNPDESESVDKQTDSYLAGRRKRALEDAKMAELEHVTEDEKTGAARSRKERGLVENDKISPIKGEENSESTEKKVQDAAEVAAAVAGEGVPADQAADLGTGKSRVVVLKPGSKEGAEEGGGWSVLKGKPVRDPEGEFTFIRALKVAELDSQTPANNKKSLAQELAAAKQTLEALGIKVGAPSPVNRSLKEEVGDAMALLESLGIKVGTSEQSPLKVQVEEARALLGSLGLTIGASGESLEVIKEKHHHEERMNELSADREYKKSMSDIAGSIPERVGHGMASQFTEGEKEPSGNSSSSGSSELEYLTCPEAGCGFRIPIPPNASSQITCPKCGTIYTRKGGTEAEAQEEQT